ncbi:MAG: hypothetical protein ACTHM1_13135 [Solirubrobacteraceae bacterium]
MIRLLCNRSHVSSLAAVWLASALCLFAACAVEVGTAHAAGGGSTPASQPAKAAPEGANGKAFGKLTGEGQEEAGGEEENQAATKTNNASTSSSKAPSTGLIVLVFAIAALLLGGIAVYIVRDARGVAPVPDGLLDAVTDRQAARARKRRTKAKAARQARKRNR